MLSRTRALEARRVVRRAYNSRRRPSRESPLVSRNGNNDRGGELGGPRAEAWPGAGAGASASALRWSPRGPIGLVRRPAVRLLLEDGGGSSLAVIGPQAKMAGLLMGNYAESGRKGNWGTAILDAITQRLGNSSGSTVQWATGCADIDCKSGDGIAAVPARRRARSPRL